MQSRTAELHTTAKLSTETELYTTAEVCTETELDVTAEAFTETELDAVAESHREGKHTAPFEMRWSTALGRSVLAVPFIAPCQRSRSVARCTCRTGKVLLSVCVSHSQHHDTHKTHVHCHYCWHCICHCHCHYCCLCHTAEHAGNTKSPWHHRRGQRRRTST